MKKERNPLSLLPLSLTLLLFLLQCARVVTGLPTPKKVLELSVWMDGTLNPDEFFYFIVLQVDNIKEDYPFPEVSGQNRGKNWTDYFLYTAHPTMPAGSQKTYYYKRISPQNDLNQILAVPERLDRKPFYLSAEVISRPVGTQSRSSNGIRIRVYLDDFIPGARRFDLTFLVATRGVDNISNPPGPDEPGRVLDSLNNVPLEIPSLAVGSVYSSLYIVGETTGDAYPPSADIAGWEVQVKQ
ncbi:MAG: hypothetical protein V2G48_02540 [bacterium JZ-2024 1]